LLLVMTEDARILCSGHLWLMCLNTTDWTIAALLQPCFGTRCMKDVKAAEGSTNVAAYKILHANRTGCERGALFVCHDEAVSAVPDLRRCERSGNFYIRKALWQLTIADVLGRLCCGNVVEGHPKELYTHCYGAVRPVEGLLTPVMITYSMVHQALRMT
jgi:hypothetical protein